MSVNGESSLPSDFSWIEAWYVDALHFFVNWGDVFWDLIPRSITDNRKFPPAALLSQLPSYIICWLFFVWIFVLLSKWRVCPYFCFIISQNFIHPTAAQYQSTATTAEQRQWIHSCMDGWKMCRMVSNGENEVITTGLFYTLHNNTWILNILRNITSWLKKNICVLHHV